MPTHPRAADYKGAARFEIREVGKVLSVRKFIVLARGLPSCINGQMVDHPERLH